MQGFVLATSELNKEQLHGAVPSRQYTYVPQRGDAAHFAQQSALSTAGESAPIRVCGLLQHCPAGICRSEQFWAA